MNDIAKEVGIKTPSLYTHFKGKEELFCSIYDNLAKEYVDLLEQTMNTAESMDIEGKLYYIFEQYKNQAGNTTIGIACLFLCHFLLQRTC